MALVSILAFFLFCHLPLILNSAEEYGNNPNTKPICPPSFDCQDLGEFTFPFFNSTDWRCGFCKLNCKEKVPQLQLIKEGGQLYDVKNVPSQNTIVISDKTFQSLLHNRECDYLRNLSLPSSPSIFFTILNNITLFKCLKTSDLTLQHNLFGDYYNCSECNEHNLYYRDPVDYLPNPQNLPDECSVIQLPSLPNFDQTGKDASDLFGLLSAEFTLKFYVSPDCYKCHSREGQCQNEKDGVHCVNAKGKRSMRLILGTVIPGAVLIICLVIIIIWRSKKYINLIPMIVGTAAACVVILIVLLCCFWSKCSYCKTMIFGKYRRKDHENIEAFLRKYGPLAPKRYRYQDVKKMTNSFKCKLGQGGYGGVYKGKLHDGRDVAVKLLNKQKGEGEEFVNEVASISRTSHVNIVTLLGFCLEGSKRALIYEFMPNGSLEKFIPNEKSTAVRQLGWETLYQIALGIARGLEYLHRGCNTRILHFDIKPHNILLDEEFCPKISDFGLAKLCFGKDSVISMLGMRGTPGYIAPEVFSRNFGAVSHKSDVYSYGMMILEMVGERKNNGVDRSTEEYFPEWIYNRLELNAEIGLEGISNEVENGSTRKMIIVGLWCIQADPSNRPSMKRVLEMLEGGLESLQIPPRPFFVSVPEPLPYSSTT